MPIWASSTGSTPPFDITSLSLEKLRHNFPKIYRGGGGGESPLLIRERADSAALEPLMKEKSRPTSSPLVLVIGGLSINISTSTLIISISISKIHIIPS
jgi:hypothetical protein